jgi:hypothetical protein
MWLGDIFPTFRSNPQLWSSWLRWIRGVVKLKIKALCFFETSGTTIQRYCSKTQKTFSLNTKTDLQLKTSFSAVSLSVCNAARFPHDFSLIFHCSLLSLSRLLNKRPDVWLYFETHALEEGERFKWTLLRKKHCLPSLSLSRMHTLQAALCGRKDSANLAFQQMRCTNSI